MLAITFIILDLIYEIFGLYFEGDVLEDIILDIEFFTLGKDDIHGLENFIAIITLVVYVLTVMVGIRDFITLMIFLFLMYFVDFSSDANLVLMTV